MQKIVGKKTSTMAVKAIQGTSLPGHFIGFENLAPQSTRSYSNFKFRKYFSYELMFERTNHTVERQVSTPCRG